MSILKQKTVKNAILVKGVGLHTGVESTMRILPSKPNTGILFKRVDLNKNNIVVPNIYNVNNTTLCTTITNEYGAEVSTIEHLMGALMVLGIDNVLIEIDNKEVPILDGSAKNFVELIQKTGFEVSESPIKIIKIEKEIEIKNNEKYIKISPSKISLDIDFEIKYKNSFIGTQKNKVNIYNDNLTDVLNSRTFCLYEDIEKLKKMGLAKGGNLDNALVVKNEKLLNPDGLRNNLEFVNHKILDCVGDLYLSGYKIVGSLICSQGGHSLTNTLLRKVFNDSSNFSIIELNGKNLPHTFINKSQLKSIA